MLADGSVGLIIKNIKTWRQFTDSYIGKWRRWRVKKCSMYHNQDVEARLGNATSTFRAVD